MYRYLFLTFFLLVTGIPSVSAQQTDSSSDWIQLFNGNDMEDWTPKFTGSELGVNFRNTFRVEDGLLKISYENWDDFNGEFGHLFYKDSFTDYRLRVVYRFVGEQVTNGPGWAFRNNGIMFHSQPPEDLRVDQEFPVSIEVQLLGGSGTGERSTANICTPGTNVVIDGELIQRHCITSSSKTYHGDQWVTAEILVEGTRVRHYINGELVMDYTEPQLDPRDSDSAKILESAQKMLRGGYISIQAESHPTEFKTIELLPLD